VSPAPAVVFAASQSADINNHRHDQDNQVNSLKRQVRIDEPGVGERGQGKKEESHQQDQQIVIRALEVLREQEKEHQNDSGKQENDQNEEARHSFALSQS
jgi:hypothetical protein